MSRKKIVAGNWKMNTSLKEAMLLTQQILENSASTSLIEKIIFPPFTFLTEVIKTINNTPNFFVGAQNCSQYLNGAFTGEVSALMLQSINCNYVLIGHSERRNYFNETNEQFILKIKNAMHNNLKVIFCFGEQLVERKQNLHYETIKLQLSEILSHFTEIDLLNITLAYEPVWAIGTGETASPNQAQEMHAFVRKVIANLFSQKIADAICILYGGSCNPQNAKQLFVCPDVDGGLIGGASLKANDFIAIVNSF